MNNSKVRLLFSWLLTFILIAIFDSSALAGDITTFKSGDDSKPKQQQVKHRPKNGGPPAQAPAHGYRAKHKYRYYPSQKVYHDTERGLYFYIKGDSWEVGASLPSHLKADLGESVILELETDKPYVHNAEHVKKYPSEKSRNAEKSVWSKLIFVLLYGHSSR